MTTINKEGDVASALKKAIDTFKAVEQANAAARLKAQQNAPQDAPEKPEISVSAIAEDFYYNPSSYPYLMLSKTENGGNFIKLRKEDCLMHARKKGLPKDRTDDFLIELHKYHGVDTIFTLLAGHKAGCYGSGRDKFIVMHSAPWIEGKEGACPISLSLLRGVFDDPENPEQWHSFIGWLKGARQRIRETLENGKPRTSVQHMAIVGERDLGKSFLIKNMIAPILATPYDKIFSGAKYFTKSGDTGFNGGMEVYPLILLDDFATKLSNTARMNIMNRLKNILYSGAVPIEAKGKDCFSMVLPWAVIQIMNPDPASLSAFPLVGDDTDKVIGLLAGRYRESPPNVTKDEKDAIDQALKEEAPALAWYIDHYQVPDELTEITGRHVCRAYVHPALASLVQELDPEFLLLELIDEAARRGGVNEAGIIYASESAATPIFDCVRKNLSGEREKELLAMAKTAAKFGQQLKALAKKYPERITVSEVKPRNLYTIKKPIPS